jgi:hypothetical protein
MTYLPNFKSLSVNGVRPLHLPLTVTPAFAGLELTTTRPVFGAFDPVGRATVGGAVDLATGDGAGLVLAGLADSGARSDGIFGALDGGATPSEGGLDVPVVGAVAAGVCTEATSTARPRTMYPTA